MNDAELALIVAALDEGHVLITRHQEDEWGIARVDGEVDPREAALLEKAAHLLELDGARVAELSALAAELPARAEGDGWAGQLKGVFVAAAARVLHT